MKKLLTVLFILLFSHSFGQIPYYNAHNYGNEFNRIRVDSSFILPVQDTSAKDNLPLSLPRLTVKNNIPYFWNGSYWGNIRTGVDTGSPLSLNFSYYSTANPIGTMINQSFAVSSKPALFTSVLGVGSITYNGANTTLSNGDGSFGNYIEYNYLSDLEQVNFVTAIKVNSYGNGVSIGKNSFVGSGPYSSFATFPLNATNNVASLQQIEFSTLSTMTTSTPYNVNIGDSLILTWNRQYDLITGTLYNCTQKYTVTLQYKFDLTTASGHRMPNMGFYAFYTLGGSQNLYNFSVTSGDNHKPLTVFTGNSITTGYACGGIGYRYSDLLYNNNRGIYTVDAGQGDALTDAINELHEVCVTISPKYVYCALGVVDAINNTDTNTFRTTYTRYCDTLLFYGITPIVSTLVPNTSHADVRPYNRQIQNVATALGLTIVDIYNALDSPGTSQMYNIYNADGTHPNAAGNIRMAQTIAAQAPILLTDTAAWNTANRYNGKSISPTQIDFNVIPHTDNPDYLVGSKNGILSATHQFPYGWLINRPTGLSQFTNDAGYISSLPKSDVYNDQTGPYLLSKSDSGKVLTFSNAADTWVTVPKSLGKGFATTIHNKGSGNVLFTDSGVVQRNWKNAYLAKPYSIVTAKMPGTDTIVFDGSGLVADTTLPLDKVTGDSASWCLCRLTWAYNGPLADITDGSGHHQRIYAIGRDLDTASVKIFNSTYSLTSAKVDTVFNSRGNGLNLVQSTAANMPLLLLNGINNRPVLNFTAASSQYLQVPSSTGSFKFMYNGLNNTSVIGVIANQANLSTGFILNNAAGGVGQVGWILYEQPTYNLVLLYGNSPNTFFKANTSANFLLNPTVFSVRSTISDSIIRFRGNGGQFAELPIKNTSTYVTGNSVNNMTMGARSDLNSYNTMNMPVIMLYPNDIGAVNEIYLEQYFNSYYGLTGNQGLEFSLMTGLQDNNISTTATLDFPNTGAGSKNDLTIILPGAAIGDAVQLGVPAGSIPANGSFSAFVSAANIITVRYANNDLTTSYDPSPGTFKVAIIKH